MRSGGWAVFRPGESAGSGSGRQKRGQALHTRYDPRAFVRVSIGDNGAHECTPYGVLTLAGGSMNGGFGSEVEGLSVGVMIES